MPLGIDTIVTNYVSVTRLLHSLGKCRIRKDCSISMMTSSNGSIFHVTGNLCGEFIGLRWIPRTKASDAELWCFIDLCLNKRLRKQSWGWWFETLSRPLWRHCNGDKMLWCLVMVTNSKMFWESYDIHAHNQWYEMYTLYNRKGTSQWYVAL